MTAPRSLQRHQSLTGLGPEIAVEKPQHNIQFCETPRKTMRCQRHQRELSPRKCVVVRLVTNSKRFGDDKWIYPASVLRREREFYELRGPVA